jgi:hypothetical protein
VLKAGVRDHRVQTTEALDRRRDRIAVALARGEIGAHVHLATHVDCHNVPAVTPQAFRDRRADSARRAGDERRATIAAHMSIPPLTPQIAPVMNEE